MRDAEIVELAVRRIAADPHAPPDLPCWWYKLADEIAKIIKDHSKTADVK